MTRFAFILGVVLLGTFSNIIKASSLSNEDDAKIDAVTGPSADHKREINEDHKDEHKEEVDEYDYDDDDKECDYNDEDDEECYNGDEEEYYEEDDEIDDILPESTREKRQLVGVPGRGPTVPIPPPATINRPIRIAFDYGFSIDSETDPAARNLTDGGLNFRLNSFDDEDSSDWFVATSTGFEYRAQASELRSIFSSARFSAAVDVDDTGVEYSGTPISDDTGPTVGLPGPTRFASPSKRSVFPPDTRRRVYNTNRFPYTAIGRFDNGCTGFFVGPRHILTAGHCVYSFKRKRWYRNLNFGRKKNCNPDQGDRFTWRYAITVKGWKNYGWASYDYAMVVVTRSSSSRMRFGWRKPIPKWIVNIAGYPVDKRRPSGCLWRSHCRIRRRYTNRLGYQCDTYNGMSGSPVYAYWRRGNRRIAYCIHAHGTRNPNFFTNNKCVRITRARFKQFNRWISSY